METLGFIKGLIAAITPTRDTRATEECNPIYQQPKPKAKLKSWFENKAYVAGYLTDEGDILFLNISEARKDRFGRDYYAIGLTKKLHHAKFFANKRRIYLDKKELPLARNDHMGREYLDKSFPVPVVAKPSIPNYNMGTTLAASAVPHSREEKW